MRSQPDTPESRCQLSTLWVLKLPSGLFDRFFARNRRPLFRLAGRRVEELHRAVKLVVKDFKASPQPDYVFKVEGKLDPAACKPEKRPTGSGRRTGRIIQTAI